MTVCVLGRGGGWVGEVEEESVTVCQGMFGGHVCVLYRGSPWILISTATTTTSSSCPTGSHLRRPPTPIPTRWPHSRGIARYIIRGVRFILSLHPIRDPLLPVKEQLDTTVIAGGGKLAAAEQYFMHDACRGQYKDVVYFTHENAIMTRH